MTDGWQHALEKFKPKPPVPKANPRPALPRRAPVQMWSREEIIEVIKAAPCLQGENDVRAWIRDEMRKASLWYKLKEMLWRR